MNQEKEFQEQRITREEVGEFKCAWCDFSTWDKRGAGLHTQHNHKEHMEEWLQIYDDGLDWEWKKK